MRIIAGRFGGRRLTAPKGSGTRPTTDRVREALFSILAPRIEGARVLDLFSGTGALGLEALSRGAASATFVERDRRALAVLRTNVESLGLTGGEAEVVGETAARYLARNPEPFDLIFADPPWEDVPRLATELFPAVTGVLRSDGLLLVEHRSSMEVAAIPELKSTEQRRYGDTALSFFRIDG